MEPSLDIRTAYANALLGNITLNGDVVPISDGFAPPENKYPYVIVSSQVEVQRGVKKCKQYEATILLDIVTGSTDPMGRADSEKIANQIENIVIPANFQDLPTAQWEIGLSRREQSFDRFERNDIFYVYRKLIRYSHLISEKGV